MTNTKNKRIIKILIRDIIILVAGLMYALIINLAGLGIPCVFRTVTGYKCPGCGISHMCIYLFNGEIGNAYNSNEFLFITLPILILLIVVNDVRYVKYENRELGKVGKMLCVFYIVALIIFGILRNIF